MERKSLAGDRIDVGVRIEVVAQQDDMVAGGGVFDGEDVFEEGEVFVEVGYDEDAHVMLGGFCLSGLFIIHGGQGGGSKKSRVFLHTGRRVKEYISFSHGQNRNRVRLAC